ncbi:guanylate kinase [Salisediminibacterium halotolerans]|uniref:Guanylate kinase n=1 Tax=Salisediminibacterium halotolerans TaxID=517425 RepID=A0A1H9PYF0_9BACI|nr:MULTISPECIES: guanylate kinase [Salisediminibacterium]RLJ74279.1 guanylate kinase [Actinophytocola xinjiangensis]RPE87628.1 guanylate kinase [Salisediminibacterium halotolerans]TWG35116.1 guanylate kinase [Salisediminibacterium halotolerans]SER52855.1 guanylate kinase [Salisediminibacterium haloalkalitolerans]GEL07325.1 guanylate kinase [Salisediminibacterium halotolerans]
MKREKGLLIVLSGPSGVGKGTVCGALRKEDTDIRYSVSATTRAPREGEAEGVNYFYKSKAEFERMIQDGELLEYAQYVENYYGTPRSYVEDMLAAGHDVILEIEVQGALQVKETFPEGVFIFLMPPSLNELRSRIEERGTETADLIDNRMTVAKEEIDLMDKYDYVVENDEVESAVERIKAIVTAENCKKDRLIHLYKSLVEE